MNKDEISKKLNERFGISINWSNMTKGDLQQIEKKFDKTILVDDLTPENIVKYLDTPTDFALGILQNMGGDRAKDLVGEVIGTLRELDIGDGTIIEALKGRGVGKGGLLRKFRPQEGEVKEKEEVR